MYQKWDNKSISSCQNIQIHVYATWARQRIDDGSFKCGAFQIRWCRHCHGYTPASLQRGKAWKTHYRRHIAFFCCWDACGRLFFPDPHFIRYAHWQSIETIINWVFQPPLIWLYCGAIIRSPLQEGVGFTRRQQISPTHLCFPKCKLLSLGTTQQNKLNCKVLFLLTLTCPTLT